MTVDASFWMAICIGLVACGVLAWVFTRIVKEDAQQPEPAAMAYTVPTIPSVTRSVTVASTATRKIKVNPDVLRKELKEDPTGINYGRFNYAQIADMLNLRPMLRNEVECKSVFAPPDMAAILACMTPEEILKSYTMPTLLDDVGWALQAGTRERDALVTAFVSMLSNSSKKNFEALLSMTQADPNYQEFVEGKSRADELGLGTVTAQDVQNALVS